MRLGEIRPPVQHLPQKDCRFVRIAVLRQQICKIMRGDPVVRLDLQRFAVERHRLGIVSQPRPRDAPVGENGDIAGLDGEPRP